MHGNPNHSNVSREDAASSPETESEIMFNMGNETETSDLEKSQSEESIRSIRSPSILSSKRTRTPFEVVEIIIGGQSDLQSEQTELELLSHQGNHYLLKVL